MKSIPKQSDSLQIPCKLLFIKYAFVSLLHLISNATFGYNRGVGLGLIFNCSYLTHEYQCCFPFFVGPGDTFVPYHCCYPLPVSIMENTLIFSYTYVKIIIFIQFSKYF